MVWNASFATFWLKNTNLLDSSEFLICLSKADKIELLKVCGHKERQNSTPCLAQVHTAVASPDVFLKWHISTHSDQD